MAVTADQARHGEWYGPGSRFLDAIGEGWAWWKFAEAYGPDEMDTQNDVIETLQRRTPQEQAEIDAMRRRGEL